MQELVVLRRLPGVLGRGDGQVQPDVVGAEQLLGEVDHHVADHQAVERAAPEGELGPGGVPGAPSLELAVAVGRHLVARRGTAWPTAFCAAARSSSGTARSSTHHPSSAQDRRCSEVTTPLTATGYLRGFEPTASAPCSADRGIRCWWPGARARSGRRSILRRRRPRHA